MCSPATTRSRISLDTGGRPGFPRRDFHVQKSLNPLRCQPMTVSGLTITRAWRQPGHRQDRMTQKTLSAFRSNGRGLFRFRTATCCRRARISVWSAARSAKISMILCMPERVSGGDAKFQGFCDGWNKWEGQALRNECVGCDEKNSAWSPNGRLRPAHRVRPEQPLESEPRKAPALKGMALRLYVAASTGEGGAHVTVASAARCTMDRSRRRGRLHRRSGEQSFRARDWVRRRAAPHGRGPRAESVRQGEGSACLSACS